jgi:hypothetical protein
MDSSSKEREAGRERFFEPTLKAIKAQAHD